MDRAPRRRPESSPLPPSMESSHLAPAHAAMNGRAMSPICPSPYPGHWSPPRDQTWQRGPTAREGACGAGAGMMVGSVQRVPPQVVARVSVPPKEQWDSPAVVFSTHRDVSQQQQQQQQQAYSNTRFGAMSVPARGPRSPVDECNTPGLGADSWCAQACGPPESTCTEEANHQSSPTGGSGSGGGGGGSGPFAPPAGGSIKVNPALLHLLQ